MNNAEHAIDYCLLTLGSVWSLANIEHILGIIILVIQLVWISVKLAVKVVRAIKSGHSLENLDEDVDDVIDKFEALYNTFNGEEVKNNGDSKSEEQLDIWSD